MLSLFHLYEKYRYGEASARFKLYKHLRKLLPVGTCIGWDTYDMSLELYGVPPEFTIEEKNQKKIHRLGFSRIFVNHTNSTESQYISSRIGDFNRYPSKSPHRCHPKEGQGYIL